MDMPCQFFLHSIKSGSPLFIRRVLTRLIEGGNQVSTALTARLKPTGKPKSDFMKILGVKLELPKTLGSRIFTP